MPRLIILVLPMILLWLAFRTGMQVESSDAIGASGGAEASKKELSGSQRSPLERPRDRVLNSEALFEKLRGQKLLGSKRDSIVKTTENVVDKILTEISPKLLEQLSVSDLSLLRSYISNLISENARDQPWLCWGEDVTKEKAAAFHEAEKLTGFMGNKYALFANQLFNSGGWNRTATNGLTSGRQGDSVTVTWSIVPDGTSAPGRSGGASAPSNFRSWMASIYGGSVTGPASAQPWFGIFEDSCEAMAEACGITLLYEPNDDGTPMSSSTIGVTGIRGDIRISARDVDGNNGILAFAYYPDNGDIVFDSSDNLYNDTSSSSQMLFNVIGHELGHSLGLRHVCPLNETKLMEPILTTNFRGPRFDEYQSLQRLYGDALEVDSGSNNNDTSSTATVVNLEENVNLQIRRLSIDDNSDRDFFKVWALEGPKLSVTVRPGEGTYLEGAQVASGCTEGTSFDSTNIHNLSLEIVDPDGVTVLHQANIFGEGEWERITRFEIESDGFYYVKVEGDTTNAAQLYRMDLRLGDRDAEAMLKDGESVVLVESGSVKNGTIDPNETVKVATAIKNEGVLSTIGTLTATVTGSANVSIFSTEITAGIGGSETGSVDVVFGAVGECGETTSLSFEIFDDDGLLLTFEREFLIGNVLTPVAIDERFDSSSNLPADWTSVETGAGVPWDPVSARFVSALRSAFAAGVGSVSDASLISPSFELAPGGGTLSFEHIYRTEVGYDGAVLEASRDGGGWFDLIESPSVIVTGGYDRDIRTGHDSPIAGQRAWTAKLVEFITTTVELPPSWAGETLRFRWRLVHDKSSFVDGWWIDNIKMEMAVLECEFHRPALNLTLDDGVLDENKPQQNAVLVLSSELPLVESVSVNLETEGSATASDFDGNLAVTLAAGEQNVFIPLSVTSDDFTEGGETLIVTVPDDQPGFAPGDDFSETLTIVDLFMMDEWLANYFPDGALLTGDSDGDGSSELAEYLLGTDPTSSASNKRVSLERAGSGFMIPLAELPNRKDATLGVELSNNLLDWLPTPFEKSDEGLMLAPPAGGSFLRLTFSLDQ